MTLEGRLLASDRRIAYLIERFGPNFRVDSVKVKDARWDRCEDICGDTDQPCDLQPDHGGLMHSAVHPNDPLTGRYWWSDQTGCVEDFEPGRVSPDA